MTVEELMAEMTWVRRLARSLVGPEVADDVAQDAYIVASERAPGDDRPLRPWLHRVVTNLVRMRHRSTVRREAREQKTEAEPVPTADELLERVATQRALADAVLELREPYRSTIVLHYVEGLSSADIARRLGIPSATVRQRLKHALDRLRESLAQRENPPKKGWLAALIPLAHVNPPLATGALLMKKWLVAIAILVLLLVGGAVVWKRVVHPTTATESSSSTTTSSLASTSYAAPFTTRVGGKSVELPPWIALANGHARRLAGRVMFNNAPVANATVRIGVSASSPRVRLPEMTPGPAFMAAGVRQTDAQGRFDFGMMPPVNLVVSAEADGRTPTSLSVRIGDPLAVPAPENVEIVLGDCNSRVAGVVRDSVAPIAHARLLVAGLAGAESDANGAFSVCMPDSEYPNIRVEAEGYGSINVQVPPMPGVMRRDIVLVPEATISGVVVDEAGKAIPHAVVGARPGLGDGQDEASSRDTIADESGHFELEQLAPSKYGIVAFSATGRSDAVIVVAAAGLSTRDLSLVVKSRAVIRGHVMMNGSPVAGAWVGSEKSPYMPHSPHYAESQADGSFVLDGLSLGRAELNAYPYELVAPTSIDVKALDGTDVTLEVKPRASVVGTITRLGARVPNARIRVDPINLKTIASADGTYELRGLVAGTYELNVTNGRAFAVRTLTIKEPVQQTVDMDMDGGGEIHGTVVDDGGRGVANVLVSFDSTDHSDSCNAFTDDAGAFECLTLAGHTDYSPRVFSGVGAKDPFPLAAPFSPVHVENGTSVVRGVQIAIKHELVTIRGRVVDNTGAVVSDAHVTVPNTNWGDPSRTRADEAGGFIIENLVAGVHYDLRARTSDGASGDAHDVLAGATNVEIKLIRPGSITGTLVGLPGVGVIAGRGMSDLDDVFEAKIDGDHFSITGVSPGRYTVQAVRDRKQVDAAVVDVKEGGSASVTLRDKARAAISGRVTDLATGTPIARMACRAALSFDGREGPLVGGMVADTFTDATGAFSLEAAIGRVRVTCNYPGPAYSMAGADVDITSGPNTVALTAVAIPNTPGDAHMLVDAMQIPPTVTKSAAAGILPGDQILSVDGVDTSAMVGHEGIALIISKGPGATVTLVIQHDGKRVTVRVPLGAG